MDYNKVASEYDTYSKEATSDWLIGYPRVIDIISPIEGKTILDFGCGTGKVSRRLRDRGAKVIGVDISDPMLEIARKEGSEGIEYRCIESSGIDFIAPCSVDHSFAAFVFCNINSADRALSAMRAIHRALKPGGKFVILNANWEACNGREFISYKFDRYDKLSSGQKVSLVLKSAAPLRVENYFWSVRDYHRMLKEAGFDTITIHRPLADNKAVDWKGEDSCPLFLILEGVK